MKLVSFDKIPVDYDNSITIIFNHVPKCGGSTFSSILFRNFFSKGFRIYSCINFFSFYVLTRFKKELFSENNIIYGHFTWNIHKFIFDDSYNGKIYYLTLLRDPWEMFISSYKFNFRRKIINCDLISYFDRFYKHNFLTHWFGNGDLENAKKILQNKHFLFGLVEKYEEFLKIFGYLFRIRKIEYTLMNKAVMEFSSEDLLNLKNKFVEKNHLDYEFYSFAKDLFDNRFIELKKEVADIGVKKNEIEILLRDKNISLGDNVLESEKRLIEQIVKDSNKIDLSYLLMFYNKNRLWGKLFALSNSILNVVNQYTQGFSDKNDPITKYALQLEKQRNRALNFLKGQDLSNLEQNFNKLTNRFLNSIAKKAVIFLPVERYEKIGFYGISSRFFYFYPIIKNKLINKKVFLFDSDIKKHGQKVDNLTINNPDKIVEIKPDIIIISSIFWKEILKILRIIQKRYKLNFRIGCLHETMYFRFIKEGQGL